jgi:hypothetical protein
MYEKERKIKGGNISIDHEIESSKPPWNLVCKLAWRKKKEKLAN